AVAVGWHRAEMGERQAALDADEIAQGLAAIGERHRRRARRSLLLAGGAAHLLESVTEALDVAAVIEKEGSRLLRLARAEQARRQPRLVSRNRLVLEPDEADEHGEIVARPLLGLARRRDAGAAGKRKRRRRADAARGQQPPPRRFGGWGSGHV